MMDSLRNYAKIGLVHHMLYPEITDDPHQHLVTLETFLQRKDIDAFDFCIPYAEPYRSQCKALVKASSLDKCYALHLFPARKISLGSCDLIEQEITKLVVRDQIRQAAESGAKSFIFVSGADIPYRREQAFAALEEFCLWFCQELEPYGITPLLEPFDREIDKKFLVGTIEESVALCNRVRARGGHLAIELDIAHLPLMGEDIATAIRKCGSLIQRVHLGNCVLRDPSSIWYGDMHPPMTLESGEIGLPECRTALKALYEIGYLNKEHPKPLIFEMRPIDGIEKTISASMALAEAAWSGLEL